MPELKGRIALVTGGRRTRPLALSLATRGATVVVTVSGASTLARRLAHTSGNPHVHGLVIDLTSPDSVRAAAADFIARYRRLHLLVTDVVRADCPLARLGPFLLANLLLDTMKRSGGGKVVRLLTPTQQPQIWAAG